MLAAARLRKRMSFRARLDVRADRWPQSAQLMKICVTDRPLRRTLVLEAQMTRQLWDQESRLTPWALLDLERIAMVAELRASELTDEERRIVRDVARRLQ